MNSYKKRHFQMISEICKFEWDFGSLNLDNERESPKAVLSKSDLYGESSLRRKFHFQEGQVRRYAPPAMGFFLPLQLEACSGNRFVDNIKHINQQVPVTHTARANRYRQPGSTPAGTVKPSIENAPDFLKQMVTWPFHGILGQTCHIIVACVNIVDNKAMATSHWIQLDWLVCESARVHTTPKDVCRYERS